MALWYNCNYNLIAPSCTKDVEDILHDVYIPSTPDDMSPFREKKTLVLSFVQILLTQQGKKIVRQQQGDKDEQKVYAKLSSHELKYTKALINTSKLFTYITSTYLGYGSRLNTT